MCGIAGILNLNEGALDEGTPEVLSSMIRELSHRGPDESGFFMKGAIALGHARLSIIDLSTGSQPICNEDRSVWIIFNGEIFNYLELKEDLEKRGHRFSTKTDTEVIIHSYEEKGMDCLNDLNGQFALALWDEKKQTLYLARDRVGICPLFYTTYGGRMIFASEVKSIFQYPGIERKIDFKGLDQIFTLWTTIPPRTIFQDISEIPAGNYLEVKNGKFQKKQYWDFDFHADDPPYKESFYAEQLTHLLVSAITIRLRSDVPVGVYLSGGLDSSIVASLIHRFTDNSLKTFSITFENKDFDESSYQKQMVDFLGTDHSSVSINCEDIYKVFSRIIWHSEKPILRTSPAPLYRLSKLVNEHNYKVVLSGEGADEFFTGYNIFKEAKIREFWAKDPDSIYRPLLLKKLYPYLNLPRDKGNIFLKKFFNYKLTETADPFYSHLIRWKNTAVLKGYFSSEVKKALAGYNCLEDFEKKNFEDWNIVSRAQYIEAKTFLSGYLLSTQGDRMLMANSVEGRFPFLDHRVIEFCNRIPAKLKLKILSEKNILKKASKPFLPAEITERKKQPYRAPISKNFLGNDQKGYVLDLLSSKRVKEAGYFSADGTQKLVNKIVKLGDHLGERDNMALVGILSTQLLHSLFIENTG